MLTLLRNLSESWRGMVLIAGIVAAGFVAGLTLTGWWKLPERLLLLEAHQTVVDSLQRDSRNQLLAIRQLIRQQLCLTVADRKHTSWETCLIPSYQP